MSRHRTSAAVAAALLSIPALATPAAAHSLEDPDYVTGFTADRLWAGIAALLALATLAYGIRLLVGAARRSPEAVRKPVWWNLGLAVFAILNGVAVVLTSDAGPGSGNGIVGGYIAIVVGIAAALVTVLARSRTKTHN